MKSKVACAAAVALGLSACNAPTIPVVPVADIEAVVKAVVADAKSICHVVADISDVTALVQAMIPGVDSVTTVATDICDGVGSLTAMSARFRAGATRGIRVYFHGKIYSVKATLGS